MTIENNFLKEQLIKYLQEDDKAFCKAAGITASSYVRTMLKEEGLLRKIFTPQKLTGTGELDKSVDSDKPMKIIEKQIGSTAVSLPFRDSPKSEYVTGEKFAVFFHKVATKKSMKNITELRTYSNDIRKMLTDDALKEMQTEEDRAYFAQLDTIVAANPAQQLWNPGGGVTKANILDGIKKFQQFPKKVAPGKMILNNNTLIELQKNLDWNDIGSYVEKQFTDGVLEPNLFSWPVLVTTKDDIVLDNHIYLVAAEDFVGKLFILDEPTASMENVDGDTLKWFFWENIGLGIGNTMTVLKMELT